jgi:hypothetical protein
MPVPAYNSNPFFASVGPLLGLILTMSMLYPVSRLIKALVEEKESKTKEVMKIMGLLDWVRLLCPIFGKMSFLMFDVICAAIHRCGLVRG